MGSKHIFRETLAHHPRPGPFVSPVSLPQNIGLIWRAVPSTRGSGQTARTPSAVSPKTAQFE